MGKMIVGGTFNSKFGKPSGVVSKISNELGWPTTNGGHIDVLTEIDFSKLETLLWMPNISNDYEKILPKLKMSNQKMLLISSKFSFNREYTDWDIVGRLLKSKSNLGIFIEEKKPNKKFSFKILDPLGNKFVDTENIGELVSALEKRVLFLENISRARSVSLGNPTTVDVDEEFLKMVRNYGVRFNHYVNAMNPNRFLGNASTRCMVGFPSNRVNNGVAVSRRNVDKKGLGKHDFVHVSQGWPEKECVYYSGGIKPSVDTPVQLKLYEYYRNINFMIHGHVYASTGGDYVVNGFEKYPCGALEEFDHIVSKEPNRDASNFIVNLKGHGCLIMANNVEFFNNVNLFSRPFPET